MNKFILIEKLIFEAIQSVESMGADEKLTKAVDLLSKAQNLVADYYKKNQENEELRAEIKHIFESGANETRIFEMVKTFIEKRYHLK